MKPTSEPYFELAQEGGGWVWGLWAKNGTLIARSPEPYADKKHAIQAAKLVAGVAAGAKMIVQASDE